MIKQLHQATCKIGFGIGNIGLDWKGKIKMKIIATKNAK